MVAGISLQDDVITCSTNGGVQTQAVSIIASWYLFYGYGCYIYTVPGKTKDYNCIFTPFTFALSTPSVAS